MHGRLRVLPESAGPFIDPWLCPDRKANPVPGPCQAPIHVFGGVIVKERMIDPLGTYGRIACNEMEKREIELVI